MIALSFLALVALAGLATVAGVAHAQYPAKLAFAIGSNGSAHRTRDSWIRCSAKIVADAAIKAE